MHVALRLFGLDLLDLTIETDVAESGEPGDSTTTPAGFTLPESPIQFEVPDRSME